MCRCAGGLGFDLAIQAGILGRFAKSAAQEKAPALTTELVLRCVGGMTEQPCTGVWHIPRPLLRSSSPYAFESLRTSTKSVCYTAVIERVRRVDLEKRDLQ